MKNKNINSAPKPEEIMRTFILAFCENAAELGCPKDKEVDMWFRYLSPKNQLSVCQKIMDIMDKFYYKNKCYCKTRTCKDKSSKR